MKRPGHIVPVPGVDDGLETFRPPSAQTWPSLAARHLLPPTPVSHDVRIGRLGPLLAGQGRERIVQVYGPTGLGKTTLLAGYVLQSQDPATVFRWLTLHPGNLADEDSFQHALVEAVDMGAPCPDLAAQPVDRIEQTLAALAGRTLVLVIDANALDIEPVGRTLGRVLRWTGERFKVWLASRRPCAAMLAEMRSPHLVRSLDPARLVFTPGEAKRCRELTAPTRETPAAGWPLAEAIAAGLEGGASPDGLLDDGGGLLDAAIRNEIWQKLGPDTHKALTETAMLDWVDGHFLARLLAPRPAYPVLLELDALAPLAQVRRGSEGGFRVHALLRTFALRQLDMGDPARKERVYRQALGYHAERRSPEAAMALVQETGDHALARMAFESFTSTELLGASGYNRVRSALGRLPPEVAERSGQVIITQAVMAMKEGRFPEARHLLGSVREQVSEELAYQSPSLSRVYADFVIAQHVLAFHSHTELTEAQLAEGYFWSTYTNDLTNSAFVYALRSLDYLRKGEFALAREQIEISCRKYESATAYYGLGSALLVEGMIALAAGKLGQAATLATEASVLFARCMPDDVGLIAVGECLLCEVELERGRTEGLFDRVDAALRDLEARDGWPDAFVIGYRVGTRCALAQNDHARALGLLDRAIRLMRSRGLEDIERYCRILRASVLARAPRSIAAQEDTPALLRSLTGGATTSKVGWRESDETDLLEAGEALVEKDLARLGAVADRLKRHAGPSGRTVTVIRALVLHALHADALERRDEAAGHMLKAIALAEPEEIVLPFTEQGTALLLVIEAMKAIPEYRALGRGTRSFCAGLVRAISLRTQDAVGGIAFAPRELQVLRALALRHSTKVIARDLNLSSSAVKFHLNNIYRKLGVNKRSDAVTEAQRREVIA